MGTRDELAALLDVCVDTGLRPTIDQTLPLSEAREAFERMAAGDVVGKLVLVPAPAA